MVTLRPAVLFWLATCALGSRAAIVTLDDADPRLEWTPALILETSECQGRPDNELCTGSWWSEDKDAYYNRTSRMTWGPDTSLSFSFRGSVFTVYGTILTSGARASVHVDQDAPFFFSTSPGQGETGRDQAQLYSRSGLDPNTVHDVVISYDTASNGQTAPDNRRWLVIDSILIDEVAESTITTPTSGPTSSAPASTETSHHSAGLGTAASAGIGVGVGVLAAGFLLLLLLLRRRRQRRRVDIDGSTVSYIAPTSTSGTTPMSQRQWAAPWHPESTPPSSIPPPTVASGAAPGAEAAMMPPAYTPVGRTKN